MEVYMWVFQCVLIKTLNEHELFLAIVRNEWGILLLGKTKF